MVAYAKMKSMFFDRKAVMSAVDTTTRKVLSKFGAFVRTTARHSIKKRKSAAPAGSPPSSHTGLLKKFIFFGYDKDAKSVVIGPAKLNTGTEAPHTLEYSGVTKVKGRKAHIKARPYMHPAFESEKDKLPAMWRDSIR
jgi:phage gpG-like protein